MRFLLDESADYPLAEFLRAHGHDVTAIAHDYPHALTDVEVLAIALREDRVLIANDRDFGELVVRRGLQHHGVILLRLGQADLPTKGAALLQVVEEHADALRGLIVVTERFVRIRQFPPVENE